VIPWNRSAPMPVVAAVSRAAMEGLSRQEVLHRALQTLSCDGRADRIGAWLEWPDAEERESDGAASFRGMVWDRDNGQMPDEWRRLSPQPPLPEGLLISGRTVEQEMEDGTTIFGPLVGLRRAMWVPIERQGHLQGVLLAGSRGRHGVMPRELLESMAAELSLAIGYEEQLTLARQRQADVGLTRTVLDRLGSRELPERILAGLTDNCTMATKDGAGLGATFAVIGVIREQRGVTGSLEGRAGEIQDRLQENMSPGPLTIVDFLWASGDKIWKNAVESFPTSEIWRKALIAGQRIAGEPHSSWMRQQVARMVAVPLRVEEQFFGVLMVGLGSPAVSLETLERVDLRASLAASALAGWKRNQENAQHGEWRKSLLENSNEAIFLLDSGAKISAASAGAKLLLLEDRGRERGEARDRWKGKSLGELFQGSDRERINEWSERVLFFLEERRQENRRGPGELPEGVLQNGVRVRMHSALPAGGPFVAVSMELWRQPETVLGDRRGAAELRSVLEWMEEGIILFDAQENVSALNTRFLQLAGLRDVPEEELKTLDALILMLTKHVVEPWSFAQRWRNLARGIDGDIREEVEFVLPTLKILQRASRPILDIRGQRIGRLEIYRDLTSGRRAQSKMLHTEKLAALGQTMTRVAHELTSPLTSIIGYTHRLMKDGSRTDSNHEIGKISQEAERARTILRQLLLDAHDRKPDLRTVSLNQVVLRAVELQQGSMSEENIRMVTGLDPNLPLVHGDAGRLQQVLMNLMGNARQALEQAGRGGTVRVRTKQIGEERVLLEIADDGPGIPKEILGRIFDPFFTTKPVGSGTGLGLAIVLGIVQEHGGHVNVESPSKGGAVFSIALRAAGAKQSSSPILPMPSATIPALPPMAPRRRWVNREPQPATLKGMRSAEFCGRKAIAFWWSKMNRR
jgi:signal transduction histidine kinase